jgi:hypothetical protein
VRSTPTHNPSYACPAANTLLSLVRSLARSLAGDLNYFRPGGCAIKHQGDNTTGAGAGDDERIDIDLDLLGPDVAKIVIVVNIYSSGGSFSDVSNAYVRMCAIKNGHELARFKLEKGQPGNGLLFATLHRSPVGTWLLSAQGDAIHNANTAKDANCLKACKIKGTAANTGEGTPSAGDGCCIIV